MVLREHNMLTEDKLLPYLQHGFIRPEKNVVHYHLSTLKIALVFCMFYFVLRCYPELVYVWQMELPQF